MQQDNPHTRVRGHLGADFQAIFQAKIVTGRANVQGCDGAPCKKQKQLYEQGGSNPSI